MYYWPNALLHKEVIWRKIVKNYLLLQWSVEYYPNLLSPMMNGTPPKITLPYKNLRKLNTEMIRVKSFVKEQFLLVKNTLKDKLCKSTKLNETSDEKHSVDEVRQLRKGKNRNWITPVPVQNYSFLIKRIISAGKNTQKCYLNK